MALVRYEPVSAATGVPYSACSAVHLRESTFRIAICTTATRSPFCTVHVPAGRPIADPPTQPEQSTEDALRLKHLQNWTDWSLTRHALPVGTLLRPGLPQAGASQPL